MNLNVIYWKIKRRLLIPFGYKIGYAPDSKQTYYEAPELGIKGRRPGTDLETRIKKIADFFFVEGRLKCCRTLLDVGCAEGLITREFIKHGVDTIHGFDIQEVSVDNARRIFAETNTLHFFGQADLSDWSTFTKKYRDTLLEQYDVVLFLDVHQHLLKIDHDKADRVMLELAKLAKKYYAVRSSKHILENELIAQGFSVAHRESSDDDQFIVFSRG